MDHRSRFSTLSASYDDFLFAPVYEDPNGIRLSVLSALARMDVDPWEEATRLAAMPKAIAETTLLSILDLVSGKNLKSSEAAAAAARLVRLLPQPDEAAASATATLNATIATAHRTNYRWLWLGFWIAITIMMPHRQTTPPNATVITSESGATSQFKTSTPDPVGLSSQSSVHSD